MKERSGLDEQVAALAVISAETEAAWSEPERLAFWLNAYNVLTLALIADHYPVTPRLPTSVIFRFPSIRHIHGAWDRYQFKVAGRDVSLNQIEHAIVREQFDEPRVHFALVCASTSCPPLRDEPYEGAKLEAQLADQTRRFLAHERNLRIDREAKRVSLSSIFLWFKGDFSAPAPAAERKGHLPEDEAVLEFVARHHPDPEVQEFLRTETYALHFMAYDWSLNEQPTAR